MPRPHCRFGAGPARTSLPYISSHPHHHLSALSPHPTSPPANAQLTTTLANLNSGAPIGIYARLSSLFMLCRAAIADAQIHQQTSLLAWLLQLRSVAPSMPQETLPSAPRASLPGSGGVAAAPRSIFAEFCTAFPFAMPTTVGWASSSELQAAPLSSIDEIVISVMLHPRTAQVCLDSRNVF